MQSEKETDRLLHVDVESVNTRFGDMSNDTLLHKAAREGHREIVNELLNNHADVNAENKYRFTALMEATLQGHTEIVMELLNHHVDVNAQNDKGITALMYATEHELDKIVIELLNHHADVNIQGNDGFTALMLAASKRHSQFVKLLCNHNADVNLQDNDGNTALHLVLLGNITDTTINIIELLLTDRTNLEKVNEENKSVMQLAKECQNQGIINLMDDFAERKKIKAAKRELKKLQANRIFNKRKKKLHEINALNDEILDLSQKINQVKMRNTELKEEIKYNCEKIKTWQCTLETKKESRDLRSPEKLKEDIEYFERCIETERFDDVIQLAKRECPICFNGMRPNEKIYQCQSGHICCEECFDKIKEKTKICSFCGVDIVSNPIRCRALEEVIEEEANK